MSSNDNSDDAIADLFDRIGDILNDLDEQRKKTSVDYTARIAQLTEQVSAMSADVVRSTTEMSNARRDLETNRRDFLGDVTNRFNSAAERFIKPYVDRDPPAPVIKHDYRAAISITLIGVAAAFLFGVGCGFPISDWCRAHGYVKQLSLTTDQQEALNWAANLSKDDRSSAEWGVTDAGRYARKFDSANQGNGGIQGIGNCTGNKTGVVTSQGSQQICTIMFWLVR